MPAAAQKAMFSTKRFVLFLIAAVVCVHAQASSVPRSFSEIKILVQQRDVRSVEELLPLLDLELKSNYSLIVKSRSTQDASFENPRVNLFSKDASFLLSFNGGENQKGGNSIEMIEFNKSTRLFNFSRIQFVDGVAQFLSPSESASQCLGCHSSSSRDTRSAELEAHPIWESYPDWPDRYGASHFPREGRGSSLAARSTWLEENFENFKDRALNHPRYSKLVDLDKQSLEKLGEMNTRYGDEILKTSFKKLVRQIVTNEKFEFYKSAWMVSQGSTERLINGRLRIDQDSENKFLSALPIQDKSDYSEKIDSIRMKISRELAAYYSKKTERYAKLTRTSPIYTTDSSGENPPAGSIVDFDSGHISDLARLQFLLEKMNLSKDLLNLTLEKETHSIVQGAQDYGRLKDVLRSEMQDNSCLSAF